MMSSSVDEVSKLLQKALGYLGYRDRSELEMIDYLKRKQEVEDIDVINQVILKLVELDLLDDQSFAIKWTKVIRLELKQKGIVESEIQKALNTIGEVEWMEAAQRIISKKMSKISALDKYKKRDYIYKLLYSKGFESRIIRRVIDDSHV